MGNQVLEGIRILDLSRAFAGAYGSVILGELGAEIIKIENIPSVGGFSPDAVTATREIPITNKPEEIEVTEPICHFWSLNHNKKGICLNLKTVEGKQIFYELVKKSDVVYDNFRPRVLKRLQIDYETLKEINPRIISCSVTGFGSWGPWRDQPAFDVNVQALGGAMSITGEPGRVPCRWGVAIGDAAGGIFASLGILSALWRRERTGVGQRVDVSMLDAQLHLETYRIPQATGMGMTFSPQPQRSGGGAVVPYGPFKCKDGRWITVAGTSQFWESLCKVIGREDLAEDPKYDTTLKRRQREKELTAIFKKALMTKQAGDWEKLMFEAGVPTGIVNTINETIEHPQIQARDMVATIEHPLGKKMKFSANPIKFSDTPSRLWAAPGLGEHTVGVITELLGYSQEKLDQLKEDNVIWWPSEGFVYERGVGEYA